MFLYTFSQIVCFLSITESSQSLTAETWTMILQMMHVISQLTVTDEKIKILSIQSVKQLWLCFLTMTVTICCQMQGRIWCLFYKKKNLTKNIWQLNWCCTIPTITGSIGHYIYIFIIYFSNFLSCFFLNKFFMNIKKEKDYTCQVICTMFLKLTSFFLQRFFRQYKRIQNNK